MRMFEMITFINNMDEIGFLSIQAIVIRIMFITHTLKIKFRFSRLFLYLSCKV